MENRAESDDNEQMQNKNDINEISQITASLEVSDKFWSNDVIWTEITSYLSIPDLKDLSCVNNYFLQKVRSINRFTSMAGQVVTGKLEIHVFKLCRAILMVNKIDTKALQKRASKIFQDTEYLEIHGVPKLSYTERNSRLIQIIKNCPKLKSLAFGRFNFLGESIEYFLKHSKVKLILSQLKELHLERLEVFNKKFLNEDRIEWFEDERTKTEIDIDPYKSFKLLSEMRMSLFKFSYQASPFVAKKCFFSPELVLSSSQNTLVELKLHVPFGSTLGLENMKFPTLEKFSLVLTKLPSNTDQRFNQQIFDKNFTKFIKNHLLSLTHFELDSQLFDISFTAVCELLKSSKKIRVLLFGREDRHLVGMHKEERSTIVIGKVWDNLANIPNLCSLEVWTGHSNNNVVPILHNNLPDFKRYGEILHRNANSFKFWGHSWKDFDNPDYFTATVKSTFLNFQNLVELKLFAFLNDEILQFVCKKLTKLLVFEGDFSEVTDYGISGIREHDNYNSGISIANLKGLRRLHMCRARYMGFYITWDGLLESIHFLELVDLRVRGKLKNTHPHLTEEKCRQCRVKNEGNYLRLICKTRNPCLEKVFLAFYQPHDGERENIRRVNPRTKFHRVDGDGGFFENC